MSETLFDKTEVRRWRRTVWRAFAGDGFTGPQIPAAMVMAAIDVVGTDVPSICEITGSSSDYVRKVLKRLRANGVVRGRALCVAWDRKDSGWLAPVLDALVATGEFTRPVDPKRSAAQKARASETRKRGPQSKQAVVVGPFVPLRRKSNPLYGLAAWDTKA